jgi:tRNA-Thr(GGU) m(6)t(6)A37 methyltransferase TsaA
MSNQKFEVSPIGIIRSPYKPFEEIPIQGRFKDDVEAWLELEKRYTKGLKDLDKFSHVILLYYFHKSDREEIEGKPFLEGDTHGIFAIRNPHRPNHIGFSIVKIKKIEANRLYFTQVDMWDGTPLVDIKPYVSHFDSRENTSSGWIEKHFKDGKIPKKTMVKNVQ